MVDHRSVITISTYGFDNKSVSMFKYALRKFEKCKIEVFSHTDIQQADILFFDIDEKSAQSKWQNLAQSGQVNRSNLSNIELSESGLSTTETLKHKKTAAVIRLSHTPIEDEYGINIIKPLSMTKLFSAIENCIEECLLAAKSTTESIKKSKTTSIVVAEEKPSLQQVSTKTESISGGKVGKRTNSEQAAVNREVSPSKTSPIRLTKEMFFDQEKGLLGVLQHIYTKKMAALIYLESDKRGLFYAIPANNTIYIKASGTKIKNICNKQQNVSFSELETHSFDVTKIAHPYHEYPLDNFIWLIALMTSKGKIPLVIDPAKNQLGLKHWPNLSRYKSNPEFLRFAAFFCQTPTNYLIAQKLLNPSSRYLANFVSACYALRILTIEPFGEEKKEDSSRLRQPHKYRKVIVQIFSRLFKSR